MHQYFHFVCVVGGWDCGLEAVSNHCPCDFGSLKWKYSLMQPHTAHRRITHTHMHAHPRLELRTHKLIFPCLIQSRVKRSAKISD